MKYKLQKWCIRLSSVFAVLAVLVLVAVPALAAPIDYNDYVTNVEVDGDNDIVTVIIPAEMAQVFIHDMDGNEIYRDVGSDYYDIPLADYSTYKIQISPFGYPWLKDSGLDLSYLPVGTVIASGFGFDTEPRDIVSNSTVVDVMYYYDPVDYYFSKQIGVVPNETLITDVYTVESVDGASALWMSYTAYYEPVSSVAAGIYIMDTKMVFTISSLLRQQQATGKTNALLKEVEAQLADQGKTLDDIKQQQQDTNDKLDGIINGDVKPESPEGSDRFDDLEDLESGLLDDSQSGMEQGEQITQNALEVVLQYATAFACAGWIFERFTSIPIFTALLTVSLALGLYAFIVNLVQDISRASVRAERKSHRKDRRNK